MYICKKKNMSKVILLSGSPKENGNTMQVLGKMAEAIEKKDINTEIISIAGMNITDCMNIQKGGGYPDDFDKVIDKIKTAQGLIIAGPVYWGTMRAELMTALHRIAMADLKEKFLAGKIGGPVAIARRGGQTSSIQEALMFYLYHDMIIPGSTYWNIVFGKNPGEALKDEEGMKTVIHFAENVANLVKKLF